MILLVRWSLLASLFIFMAVGSSLAGIAKNLTSAEAYQLLQGRGAEVFLLDVRTAVEFREVRLDGGIYAWGKRGYPVLKELP